MFLLIPLLLIYIALIRTLTYNWKWLLAKIVFKIFVVACLLLSSFYAKAQHNANIDTTNNAIQYTAFVPNCWISQFAILERWIAGMRPTVTARALAYIHIGAYEAVLTGMPNFRSNQDYISGMSLPKIPKSIENYNWNIVLNAYYAKADSLFLLGALPEWKATITTIKDSINKIYQPQVNAEIFANSEKWGKSIAEAIYRYAVTDKIAEIDRSNPYPRNYQISTENGFWK